MKNFAKSSLVATVVTGLLTLTACQGESSTQSQAEQSVAAIPTPAYSELLSVKGGQAQPFNNGWLVSSEKQGLLWMNDTDSAQAKLWLQGDFTLLATDKNLVVTYDRRSDRVQPILVKQNEAFPVSQLPKRDFEINWLCLQPRAADKLTYLWLGGEHGKAEQWLLSNGSELKPKLVRQLSVPVGSLDCAYQAETDSLFVTEQNAGIWQYPAQPQAATETKLFLSKPDNDITSLFSINGQLLYQTEKGEIYDGNSPIALIKGEEVERFSAKQTPDQLELVSFDDETDSYRFASVKSSITADKPTDTLPEIPAWVESDTSDRSGDTMDDPAIWVHPTEPEKSLVLGAQKRWGLMVFDMQGNEVQSIATGRINNIDIRQSVNINGKNHDIAAASLRDGDKLAVYDIVADGKVSQLAVLDTEHSDIYGMCLYYDNKDLYAFTNEKSGKTIQYKIEWQGLKPSINKVRTLSVPTQVEGCVANDATGDLYIGEEDVGVWHFNAGANTSNKGKLILKVDGDQLADDVEGLALYHGKDTTYLVVSSQGNDSYVIYDAKAPYQYKGRFRIGTNFGKGIDGSSETDGLAVTSKAVGTGAWQQGMIAVQDGRNRLPDGNQVFKWVPWSEIERLLKK
ncbi:phytase [Parashewanella curva]|uniref:Phytase n=2 Tax=Parashewanella curva TaxID=2338552 RepID=A0A3L8Q0S0_9GAMM|nr:phytase [Parashewanella curva]